MTGKMLMTKLSATSMATDVEILEEVVSMGIKSHTILLGSLRYPNLCLAVLPPILEDQEETNADESAHHYPSTRSFIFFSILTSFQSLLIASKYLFIYSTSSFTSDLQHV
jgi:hypothetical protein